MEQEQIYTDAKARAFGIRSRDNFGRDYVSIPEHPCDGGKDADQLFEQVEPYSGRRNLPKKRLFFYRLLLAGKQAALRECQIAYSRSRPGINGGGGDCGRRESRIVL